MATLSRLGRIRRIRDEQCPAGRIEAEAIRLERQTLIKNPVKGVERHHRVELGVRRSLCGRPELKAESASRWGNRDRPRKRVEAQHICVRDPVGNLGGDPAVAAADIEQASDSVDLEPSRTGQRATAAGRRPGDTRSRPSPSWLYPAPCPRAQQGVNGGCCCSRCGPLRDWPYSSVWGIVSGSSMIVFDGLY